MNFVQRNKKNAVLKDNMLNPDWKFTSKSTLETAKEDYHRTQIEDCNSKQQLFRVVGKMCNPSSEPVLPDCM